MPTKQLITRRKSPTQERSRDTVDTILKSAARILVKHGYEALNTNRVAADAGVSVGSLYQYFPNKTALLSALLENHMQEMTELTVGMLASYQGAPPEVIVPAYIRAILEAHRHKPALHNALTTELPRLGGHARIRSMHSQIDPLIRSYFEEHKDEIRPKNLELAVFMMTASVEAVTHLAVVDGRVEESADEVVEELSELILGYLGVRERVASA